jgi:propanol-preferring alcohol dehydrogenase
VKALQLTAWKSEAELRDVTDPDPGPGEVLVRVGGAGACHSDVHVMDEFDGNAMPVPLPFTLGHETAGWVEAVGPGVRSVEVGGAVAVFGAWGCGRCPRCLAGLENYCERAGALGIVPPGLGRDGGMAPYLLVPNPRWLVPIGDLDPVDAAPLTDAGLTPYHAVKRSLPLLGPGSTAVVIGAGGLGHLAVQILKALTPTTVISVDTRAVALEMARQVGADHTVTAGDGAAAEIRDLTRGQGADVVIDLVGADATLALGTAVARSLGHLTLVGIAGGSVPVSFFSPAREVSVAATYWGSLPELAEVIALARTGKIRPHVQRFSLDNATDAYRSMRAGTLTGRAVVVPG